MIFFFRFAALAGLLIPCAFSCIFPLGSGMFTITGFSKDRLRGRLQGHQENEEGGAATATLPYDDKAEESWP